MKPFDIEAAQRGEPVCTADGREVRLYAFDFPATQRGVPQPVVGVYKEDDGDWVAASWQSNGKFWSKSSDSNDLRMAPRKETRWVVTWRCKNVKPIYADAFDNEVSARNFAANMSKEPIRHSFSINSIEVDL